MDLNQIKETIEQLNPWWANPLFRFEVFARNFSVNQMLARGDNLIDIFLGSRRVGKTYLLYSTINELLDDGVGSENIIFLSAEIPNLNRLSVHDLLGIARKISNPDKGNKLYLFLDEVQELEGWEKELKLLYDIGQVKLFISGSSSLVISQGMSKLTGRFVLHKVTPLQFNEYLSFNNLAVNNLSKPELEVKLVEYFNIGGYPEYVLRKEKNPAYLKQLVDSTLYRDLINLYGIRNPEVLGSMLESMADKVSTTVSAQRLGLDLKISDETAKSYLEYLQNVFLLYDIKRKAASHRKSKSYTPKYYFNDLGVLDLFSIRSRQGHKLENAVFLKLLSLSETENYQIYYDVFAGQEFDFVTRENIYEVKSKPITFEELQNLGEVEIPKHFGTSRINIIMPGVTSEHKNYSSKFRFIEPVDFLVS